MSTIVTISSLNNDTIITGSAAQLLSSKDMIRRFGQPQDYIELHVTDPADKLLVSIIPFTDYKIPGDFLPNSDVDITDIVLDPEKDSKNLGLTFGDYVFTYHILRPLIYNTFSPSLFIKEISSNRKELRLIPSSPLPIPFSQAINDVVLNFQNSYFKEIYLYLGRNVLLPVVNATVDNNSSSLIIKLLNPLPTQYTTQNVVNLVDKIANSQVFNIAIEAESIPVTFPTLRGPNFDLDLDNIRVGPTPYYNFSQITSFQGNFAPQLQQLLGQLSASNFAINVDYTNYEDFIHFSSAARRLEGFQYKLNIIEYYTSQSLSAILSSSPTAQLDAQNAQNNINKFIQSFDGWEQYLYYESGAYAWPKQNSVKPYINYSVSSSQVNVWYSSSYGTASLYDDNNQNYLVYTLPNYITENDDNELAFKFVSSLGQMFDDVWIHIKAIADLYKSRNSLTQGISKDLVYFALQSLGIDVYTDQDGTDTFRYLYGVNPDGSYKPITGSFETLISASNYQLSGQDIQKGIYKRLYHNLPLLLKSKGTNRFIQYLNTIFGIPSTVMSYIEYGGVDKVSSSFEYEYDRFTYGLDLSGPNTVSTPWIYTSQSLNRTGFNDITPNGIEFRFKAFSTSSNVLKTSYTTQSLFYNSTNYNLYLLYTDTGSNDSIYSGSGGDFGYLQFNLGSTSITSSTVPVFTTGSDGDTSWYNVLVQRRIPDRRIGDVGLSQTYDIYIKNNNWGQVGHVASASLTTSTQNSPWYTNGTTLTFGGGTFPFSGSIQEVRLWSYYVSESTFDSHVLNPESIEGNYTTSSFNDLMTRFTLGNNLYTYNHSVINEVYSTHPDQKTQILTASFSNFPNQNNYSNFVETYYADVSNSGYANPVVDKVRIYSGSIYGTQLLPNRSIEISPIILPTKDIHLLDASLSPQDEIDRAIISQFGSTYNLDDIIGNPDTGSYSAIPALQNEFFKKFNNKYNYKDYIRLIEFFYNSLFRTLKDFIPARTNLSTGIVIKPHLLERPVVYRPQPNIEPIGLISNIDTAFITASNGGDYYQPTYSYVFPSNIGPINLTSDGRDFYVGEFPSASVSFDDVIYQYNPFTVYNSSYTLSPIHTPLTYSESIWYYGYYPLLNNVSGSVLSNFRKKLTYITNNQNKLTQILEPVELQDFTYDYIRHSRPRYFGSITTSEFYTFYTPNFNVSLYGKQAAIDKNTNQFAFFLNAFATGSDLLAMPERTNLNIKYLIDENSNLTELTKRNYDILSEQLKYNLYQVQNIFKEGEYVNIGLFDNQSPSRQINLDGNKLIKAGGFRYHPTLWKTGSTEVLEYIVDQAINVAPNVNIPSINDFVLDAITFVAGGRNYTSLTVRYIGSGVLLPTDILIRGTVQAEPDFSPGNVALLNTNDITTRFPSGRFLQPNDKVAVPTQHIGYRPYLGTERINSVTDVGITGKVANTVRDTAARLTFSTSEPLFISCSIDMSKYYPNWVLSSSLNVDYNFLISPGDVVRFTSASNGAFDRFLPELEYEIKNVFPPTANRDCVIFELNERIKNVATSSYNINTNISTIDQFIFSRKIPDETNVVIQFRKNLGLTSSGIAKNSNLVSRVDLKVANIVSELKSKLFSTVLTS